MQHLRRGTVFFKTRCGLKIDFIGQLIYCKYLILQLRKFCLADRLAGTGVALAIGNECANYTEKKSKLKRNRASRWS